jgi:hypothetical protein
LPADTVALVSASAGGLDLAAPPDCIASGGFGDLFGLFQRCAFGDGPLGGFVSCIAGGLARARVHDVLRDCPS